MVSLATLIAGKTAATIYNESLQYISDAGTRITNWRTGGPYKTLLAVGARPMELAFQIISAFASGAYVDLAQGPWLTALGEDFFFVPRLPAVSTEGTVVLTAASGAGPYTYGPGALIVSTPSGLQYRSTNASPVTLMQGGSLSVPVKADQPGARYNVSAATITQIVSPTYLGVTCGNASDWTTVAGADQEGDDRYRARLKLSRATQVIDGAVVAVTAAGLQYIALTASPEVSQVAVLSDFHGGSAAAQWVTVVVAGDGAPVSSPALAAVQAALLAPVGNQIEVVNGSALSVPVSGQVYAYVARLGEAPGQVQLRLDALRRRVGLGGTLYLSPIEAALQYDVAAVRNVELTAPASEPIVLAYNQFATWDLAGLTYSGV